MIEVRGDETVSHQASAYADVSTAAGSCLDRLPTCMSDGDSSYGTPSRVKMLRMA